MPLCMCICVWCEDDKGSTGVKQGRARESKGARGASRQLDVKG